MKPLHSKHSKSSQLKNRKIKKDKSLDKDLENTFPASDPITKY